MSSIKYFKIINLDLTVFTFNMETLDEKTKDELKTAFIQETDLKLFEGDELLIAEVLNTNNIQANRFPHIHPKILWMPVIETKEPVLFGHFPRLLEHFKSRHRAFSSICLGNRNYITFNPDTYLRNEINDLQNQLSEHLKNGDEDKSQLISTDYFEKSGNIEENIQRAYLKLYKILRDFNGLLDDRTKLTLYDDHRISFATGIFRRQEYLFVMEMLVEYLNENPIIIH